MCYCKYLVSHPKLVQYLSCTWEKGNYAVFHLSYFVNGFFKHTRYDHAKIPQNLRIALCSMSLLASFTVIGESSSDHLARKIASKLKSKYISCELRVFPDGESKITLKAKPKGKIVVVHSVYPP